MTSTDTKIDARAGTRPAVVYARISQDPGNTLEDVRRQIRKALKRVDGHGGDWRMSELPGSPVDPKHRAGERWPRGVFVDYDSPAGGGNCRQEYRRMLAAMERGEVKVVVSKALDRLWHTLAETAEELVKMRAAKVHLELLDSGPSIALDGRLVHVFPAAWAGRLTDPDAAPAAAPARFP
ncbi:MAG TPA: recombinase family protein [Streptosporangiaceae bacterium]|nr:recombinase family protein [Streptosporangiaceae bacterium]